MKVQVDIDLKDFIPEYIENKKNNIKVLYNLFEEKDFEEIRKIGHNLKGTGASYGFFYFSEAGDLLRKYAKDKDEENLIKTIKELDDYISNIDIEYITVDID